MRAIVTGAGGFCGGHLCRLLQDTGVEVFTLSLRSAGPTNFQISSIRDHEGIAHAIKSVRPDYFFHLAGIARAEDPCLFYHVNVEYALGILEAMKRVKLMDSPILLVGPASECGLVAESDLPVTEDYSCKPTSHYGISKLTQTHVGLHAARRGAPLVVVRPGNIIGARMPDHLVLSTVAKQIVEIAQGRQEPRIEMGNIQTARDFIAVADLVRIYWKLIQNPMAYGKIVNACCGEAIPIVSLVRQMTALAGCSAEIVSKDANFKDDDQPVFVGSTRRLETLVGYRPRLQVEGVLLSILSWLTNSTGYPSPPDQICGSQ